LTAVIRNTHKRNPALLNERRLGRAVANHTSYLPLQPIPGPQFSGLTKLACKGREIQRFRR
jgi:hypothetical protein